MNAIIAQTLTEKGFTVRTSGKSLVVSLNRTVRTWEIEMALGDEFEGMFTFVRTLSGEVVISL